MRHGGKAAALRKARRLTSASASPLAKTILEAPVQRGCLEVLALYGYKVWRVGQYIAEATQDAGVSDLICFHDLDGTLFCECKRGDGGVWSGDQQEFAEAALAAGARYYLASDPVELHHELERIRRERKARSA